MIWALIGSRSFMAALAILAGALGYEGWKLYEREQGAAAVEQKIRDEADRGAELASEVRQQVEAQPPPVAAQPPGRGAAKRVHDKYERTGS